LAYQDEYLLKGYIGVIFNMEILIPISLLFIFLIIGMPVALAMGVSGGVGIYMVGGIDSLSGIFQATPYTSVAHYTLLVAPMFILMGELLTASKLTKDLFDVAQKWLGHLKGGLAIATVFASGLMGALIGSSTASAAALGSSAAPQMKKHGYNSKLTMGVVGISGTLAMLIPPSTMFIIYGIMTETPIDKLFIAGILPGILTALAFCLVVILWVYKKPEDAPRVESVPFSEKVKSMKTLWPVILLITFVIIAIYSGMVTITEASGFAAFGAFVIPLLMKRFTKKSLNHALNRALKTSTMIFTVIIGAMIFGYYLTITRVPHLILEMIGELSLSKWVVLTIFLIIYLILGFFMDQIAIFTLTLPITFPIIISLGFDPIWFGVLIIKTAEIGLCTPPMGLNAFVSSGAAGEKVETTFRGLVPFIIIDVVVLAILISIPGISLLLPNLME
jgi:C4-dicarboxylate transporter, DctM subunit